MRLTTWHIEISGIRRKVTGVVAPDEEFDHTDPLYLNRMKRTFYNRKNREFPAEHAKIKVLKVETERFLQGL
jgi:hypothetical protein